MKTIVEFENCSLEIGYIGTRENVDIRAAVDVAFSAVVDFARVLRETLAAAFENVAEVFQSFAIAMRE
jgi:hypothetical protein